MASNSKQYGLILPQKANQGLVRSRPSVFNESSDSEEEAGGATDWVRKALKRGSEKTFQKQQHQLNIQKVLEEDPTVYQYDEVYDKIEEKKAELASAKKQHDKKPRYIQSLLQQAEKRKREQERRNERIIQKEREAEGDQFKDKESFVTSAYRQKLEEFKKLEEEERRQDAIEALTDVSKQKDLSGFYRHLYRTTVSGESESVTVKQQKNDNDDATKENPKEENELTHKNEEEKANNESSEQLNEGNDSRHIDDIEQADKKNNSRHYRKRKQSSGSSDSEAEDSSKSKTKVSTENLDADSDFSVDSDSSESGSDSGSAKSDSQRKNKKSKEEETAEEKIGSVEKENTEKKMSKVQSDKRSIDDDVEDAANKKIKEEKIDKNDGVDLETKPSVRDKKEFVPKPNIWIKRTVGEVFEGALQRYYQRKAMKNASKG